MNLRTLTRLAAAFLVAITLSGCLFEKTPEFYDPFPQGIDQTFADAGIPILVWEDTDGLIVESVLRRMIVQVSPDVCAETDSVCFSNLVGQQDWAVRPYFEDPDFYISLSFAIEIVEGERCAFEASPSAHAADEFYAARELVEQVPEGEEGLWFVQVTC